MWPLTVRSNPRPSWDQSGVKLVPDSCSFVHHGVDLPMLALAAGADIVKTLMWNKATRREWLSAGWFEPTGIYVIQNRQVTVLTG
jgi:hypothetical protein